MYEHLNNMKLAIFKRLQQATSNLLQITRTFSLKITVVTNFFEVFCSAFFKGHSSGHL